MKRYSSGVALGVSLLLCLTVLIGCGGSSGPKLQSVMVTPATASVTAGGTQQFKATGNYSNGTTQDVTGSVTWSSSSASVATIASGGLATGVAAGSATITATATGNISGTAALTVTAAPVLQSIAVTPAAPTVANPGSQQFTATGTYKNPDGSTSTQDITTQVTWTSSNTVVATIGAATGAATTASPGTTTITAKLGSVSGVATLTVTGVPVVIGLKVTPATATISVGSTVVFSAVELLSDNTTQPLTGTVSWSSGTTTVATVGSATGIAMAVSPGNSVITATEGSLTGTAALTVEAAVARYGFDAEANNPVIPQFTVAAATGTLTPIASPTGGNTEEQFLVHPSGHFLYAVGVGGTSSSMIQLFNVNSSTGAVTYSGNAYSAGDTGLMKGAIDPTGRFMILALSNTGDATDGIYAFVIDQTTGQLTPPTTTPFIASTATPLDVLIDQTGTYAYVVNYGDGTTAGWISAYSIDPNSGGLVALSTPTFATGVGPTFGAIDKTNTYVYVPNSIDNTISIFKINSSNGLLTAVGSPTAVTGAGALWSIAIDPSNTYLYVTDNSIGQVYGFTFGTGGALGAAVSGSPYALTAGTNAAPWGISIDPSGSLIVIDNNIANTLSLFKIGTGGALTAYPDVNLVSINSNNPIPYFFTFYSAVAGQ